MQPGEPGNRQSMESGYRAVERSAEGLRALVKGAAAATAEMPMAPYRSTSASRIGFVSAFGAAVAVFIIVSIRRGRVAWAGPDVRMRLLPRCGGGGLRSWSDHGDAGPDSRRGPRRLTCRVMAEMQQFQAFRQLEALTAVDPASSLRHNHCHGGTTWARRDGGCALASVLLRGS